MIHSAVRLRGRPCARVPWQCAPRALLPKAVASMSSTATPVRPKVVAFDLDATIWLPELYCMTDHTTLKPLFHQSGECYAVRDGWNQELTFMQDAQAVLREVSTWDDTMIAYVSRTTEIESAHLALEHLHVEFCEAQRRGATMRDVAHHHEIYPGSKIAHFRSLREELGVEYHEILFLDNERWNTDEVSKELGVVSVWCPRGLTFEAFEKGLETYEAVQAYLRRGGSKKEAKKLAHASVR